MRGVVNEGFYCIALKSSGGPSSEAQQNKIISHIQDRGHHQFKGVEKQF